MIRFDKPKAKCDGGCAACKAGKPCGKKGMGPAGRKTKSPENSMDRDDALTPQEYLDACDLGIQSQSRSYIRAHLDAAQRIDQKCGNSGIAKGKQCRKGGAASTIGKVAAVAGTVAGGVAAVKNRSAIKSAVTSAASRVKNTATAVAANPGKSALRVKRRATVAAGRTVGAVKSAASTGKNMAMSGASRVKNTAQAVAMNPSRSMKVGRRKAAVMAGRAKKAARGSMAGFTGS